jgi:hypothetical protein
LVYNTGGTPSASPPAEANEILDAEELKALRSLISHALELARGRHGRRRLLGPPEVAASIQQIFDPKPGAPQFFWEQETGREYDEIVKAAEAEFSPEVVRLLGLSKEQRPATQADVDAGRAARIGIQIDAALDERLARALHIVDRRLEQEPARVEAALQQQDTARVRASQIDARQAYDQELSRIDPTTPYAGRQDTTTAATQEDVNVGRALIVDERIPLSSLPPGDRRRVGAGEPKAPTPPPGLLLTLLHEKQQQLERDIAAGEIDSEGAFVLREAIGEAFKTLTYGRQLTEQDYAVLQEQDIDFAASGLPLPTAVSTAATAGQGSIRPFISADEDSAVLTELVSAQLAHYGKARAEARATAALTAEAGRATRVHAKEYGDPDKLVPATAADARLDPNVVEGELIPDPGLRTRAVIAQETTVDMQLDRYVLTIDDEVRRNKNEADLSGSQAAIAAWQSVREGLETEEYKKAIEWAHANGYNAFIVAWMMDQAVLDGELFNVDYLKRTIDSRVSQQDSDAIIARENATVSVATTDTTIQQIRDSGIRDAVETRIDVATERARTQEILDQAKSTAAESGILGIQAADAAAALEREKEAHEANIGLTGVRTGLGQIDLVTAKGEAHSASVARARGPQATYRQNQGDLMRRDFEAEVQRHINLARLSQVELIPDQIVGEFLTAANTHVTPATRQAMTALATRLVGTGLIPLAPTTTPTPPTPRPAPTQQPVVSTPAAAAAALDGLPSYIRPEGAFVPAEF